MKSMHAPLARRVTLLYLLLAGAWIVFSDQLLIFLVRNPAHMVSFQTTKGWLFVGVSGMLLYGLLRHEVHKRHGIEAELRRVNRALRTLSECNQVLVRATSEPELLQQICQSIVTVGGYCLAWVGYAEQDGARSIRPVAQAGFGADYPDVARITWDESERGRGPTGTAIRTGQPQIAHNLLTDPTFAPWRTEASRRGYTSSIALPLIIAEQTFGALNIYATERDAFDGEEVRLLMELAEDLAHGIAGLRLRAAHQQAETALAWESQVNASLAELSRHLIELVALDEIATMLLNHAKRLTDSPFGFVGYIDPQTGHLVCPTMTRDIWDTCQVADKRIVFEQFGGLWGWVLTHRQALLTNNPAEDARSTGTPIGHVPIVRFLSVPALMGATLLGQIALANAPRAYTDQDLHVIERMASLYALAVQRKRDEDAVRRYARRLQHMHEIDWAILTARSPTEIATGVLNHLQKLMTHQHGCVALFEFANDTARILAICANGQIQPAPRERVPLATFRQMGALWEGEIHRLDEPYEGAIQPPCWQQCQGENLCSFVSVPLVAQHETIGALTLRSTSAAAFKPDELEIVREVANQLAIAIQQADLFEQVRAGRERLQSLSRRLVEIQESERRHIAREMHDEIGQSLTGLHLLLEMINRTADPVPVGVRDAQVLVNDLMSQVREISLNLRPAMLDDLGLLPTLRWHFNRYMGQTGIQVIFKHHGIDRRFAPEIETAVYRLVQEALTNVARHAQVQQLTVRFWATDDLLEVQIADQGAGFDLDRVLASNTSSGLAGMHERVDLLGGTLIIDADPGRGTCLTVRLPLEQAITA